MSEQPYPISCQSKSCGKLLYGPVSYCPYCGAVLPDNEAEVKSPAIERVTEDIVVMPLPVSVSVQQPPPAQDEPPPVQAETPPESPPEDIQKVAPEVKPPEQKSEPVPEKTLEKPKDDYAPPVNPPPKPGNLKLIAIAVVLVVGIAGYLILHKKGEPIPGVSNSNQTSSPATQGQGKKDSARIAAQDALRQGTDLSGTVSKLPKLENVLKAAKQLGDISPRYQEQVVSAESTVSDARAALDKNLMAYIGKVVELARYTPDQISYAMGVIQSGDLAPREKIVAELLHKHVSSLRNNSKAGSKKILSDFTQRFNDFMD